jgi:hypothetical protein
MTDHEMSRAARLKKGMQQYALISAYLYVCFSVLALYRSAILIEEGVVWVPFGFAIVQALVLGKFILIGEHLSVGKKASGHPLLHRVAWKSLSMLLLLVIFKILEELLVGLYHGHSIGEIASELLSRPWWAFLAPVALMLLILIPLVTATEVIRMLGGERFREYLLTRRQG